MASIFYVHWNEAELAPRVAEMREAGYDVDGHSSSATAAKLREPYPDAVVISLDRLPSHGRAIAAWLWEAKKRQTIPLLFAGGQPDKVAATRTKFPAAHYCATTEVVETLRAVLAANAPAEGKARRRSART